MEEHEVVQSLAALAHPARLQMFRALVVVGQPGLTPGTMSQGMNIPAATVSFHLKELVHADLVTQERSGRNLVYRAAFERMNAVLGYLTAHCCQGEACAASPSTSASACNC